MHIYSHQNSAIRLITIQYCFIVILLSINTVIAQEDTVIVGTGWNMVGSLYNGPALEIVRTEPAGIIVSQFFGYNPGGGYEGKDTLKKGIGYWVKVIEDGIIIFTRPWTCGSTIEYSGKIYNTVLIGTQCWLRENLDVGVRINGSQNASNNGTIEKYCYNDDPANCNTYGGLYQWDEAMQYTTTPGTRGICPEGWHIPTYEEFQTLSTTVGGDGNALKAIGQGTGSGAGTNTSGFSALLAGYRYDSGDFDDLSDGALFWSSTEDDSAGAYYMDLDDGNSDIYLGFNYKDDGFSVRCLQD